MSCFIVAPVAVNRPGENMILRPKSADDRFGLIEATSKDGKGAPVVCGDCARTCGAFPRPNTTGPATAAMPIAANSNFLPKLSLSAKRCVMIRTIRFLRSEPATPDTQASGDSTQNSQVFKIL